MAHVNGIFKHLRLFLTAVTLLCALTINHKEIPAYVPAKAPNTAVDHSSMAGTGTEVVKQKISFEAVTSSILLDLAQPFSFLRVFFEAPTDVPFRLFRAVFSATHYFSILFADSIQPNAP